MEKKSDKPKGHSNPKCFASILGNCKGDITKEHYVSRNLLTQLGQDITVSGFRWLNQGESRVVGISSLTAKILCKRHNAELSKIDDKIGIFFSTLRKFTTNFNGSKSAIQVFNGGNIELWALKVVCGFTASGNFSIEGDPIHTTVREDWIKILFSKKPFPQGLGAYIFAKINDFYPLAPSFLIAPWYNKDTKSIGGASLTIGGIFKFDIFLMDDIKPTVNHRYHPKSLNFKQNDITHTIELSWKDIGPVDSIDFNMVGSSAESVGKKG